MGCVSLACVVLPHEAPGWSRVTVCAAGAGCQVRVRVYRYLRRLLIFVRCVDGTGNRWSVRPFCRRLDVEDMSCYHHRARDFALRRKLKGVRHEISLRGGYRLITQCRLAGLVRRLRCSSLNSVMRSVGPTSVRVRDIRLKMSIKPITNHQSPKYSNTGTRICLVRHSTVNVIPLIVAAMICPCA